MERPVLVVDSVEPEFRSPHFRPYAAECPNFVWAMLGIQDVTR